MIRSVEPGDAESICDIYNHYIVHTAVTFEEQPVPVLDMQERIEEMAAALPWLVYEEDDQLLGYAYASEWKSRCAYRYSVESTVYLAPDSTGQGIGSQLYAALIAILGDRDLHSVLAGITLPNPASVTLHEKLGFEQVGQFKEVGRKFDRWIDVGYWELILPDPESLQ